MLMAPDKKMNVFERLWNMSPASFYRGLHKRIEEKRAGSHWESIQRGPLKGVELYLPPSGPVWEEMISGYYDEFLYKALEGVRSPSGANVWDIGAHVGYHSLSFAARGASVLAFEPNAANLERLKMNMARNTKLAPKIRHLSVAVSDSDGEVVFKQSGDLRGLSMGGHLDKALPPLAAAGYASFTSTVVPTVKIDTLVSGRGEKPPDIIKIDVEGAEELVLRGGENTIRGHKSILLIEIHHICLMYSVQNLLNSWGYTLRILDQEHATPSRCFVIATARQ
jgi:FkbM family methyltransferase